MEQLESDNNPAGMLRTDLSDLSRKLSAFSIGFIKSNYSNSRPEQKPGVGLELDVNGTAINQPKPIVQSAAAGSETSTQPQQLDLIEGRFLTKEKRQEHFGKMEIGKNSDKMEKYQRKMVEKYTLCTTTEPQLSAGGGGTSLPCIKTNCRINTRTSELEIKRCPNTEKNGYDYTEDFDGLQEFKRGADTVKIYYNFKSVSSGNSKNRTSGGGSQTRTLRDGVYRFVEDQLKVLLKQNNNPTVVSNPAASNPAAGRNIIYFANLLDGDMCYENMDKYKYLLDLPEYASVKKYIYVGDTATYCKTWFKSICS